jgi:sugar phosphate isomerase/epimerase
VQLVVFSKSLKEFSIDQLVELARELGVQGYDLAVRPGYPVNPDNAGTALPQAVKRFQENGLGIPMVTAHTGLLHADQEEAEPLLEAMDRADVRRLKLGYYRFDPVEQHYWKEVEKVRWALEGWAKLAEKYGVRVCYHTHSHRCMGLNAGTLAHLIRGFDPQFIGAYLDTAHLLAEGEEFAVAASIVREHLSMVAAKDLLIERVQKGSHGSAQRRVVEAGKGMVDWSAVFSELCRIGFQGPVSVHCEFEVGEDDRLPAIRREVAFFRGFSPGAAGADWPSGPKDQRRRR